jgi:hypothetical protein
MASEGWLGRQYNDIKGNLKWDAIKVIGGAAIAAAYLLLQKIRHLEYDWWVAGGLFVVSVALFVYAGRARKNAGQQLQNPSTGKTTSVIAVKTGQPFNAAEFFRLAYYSPAIQAETEARMRNAADEEQPNDREGFYLKFISVGLLMYNYDSIWFLIYRSQLEALLDINRHNGILPLAQVRTHYDQAAAAYPEQYKKANVTLENWLGFLVARVLIIRHPSDMIEITVGGKDFLKYLVHWGREANQRYF